MIVWGGWNFPNRLNTGGKYNPSTDRWTATSTINAPEARYYHPAVWTGSEMIVWGGNGISGYTNTGGDIIPSLIVGHPPAPSTRPLAGGFTRQSGPAAKWLSGAERPTGPCP